MRELIQLILSIFFGLLPLWLILARRRNRSARPTAPPTTEQEAPEDTKPARSAPTQFFNLPPWENETIARIRNLYREREQKAVDIPHPTTTTEEAVTEPASSQDEERHKSLDTSIFPTLDSSESTESQEPTKVNEREDNQQRTDGKFSLLSATQYSELKRAVIFAEILAPPRALQEWEPLS